MLAELNKYGFQCSASSPSGLNWSTAWSTRPSISGDQGWGRAFAKKHISAYLNHRFFLLNFKYTDLIFGECNFCHMFRRTFNGVPAEAKREMALCRHMRVSRPSGLSAGQCWLLTLVIAEAHRHRKMSKSYSEWIRQKRHTIAHGLYFSDAKNLGDIPTRSPQRGRQIKAG